METKQALARLSSVSTVNIMGVEIAAIDMDRLLEFTNENIGALSGEYICVSNVHTTVMSYEDKEYRDDITVVKCPATDIAIGLNSERNANIVMVGKIIKETDMFTIEEVSEAMCAYFEEEGKGKFNEKNVEVLMAGYNA